MARVSLQRDAGKIGLGAHPARMLSRAIQFIDNNEESVALHSERPEPLREPTDVDSPLGYAHPCQAPRQPQNERRARQPESEEKPLNPSGCSTPESVEGDGLWVSEQLERSPPEDADPERREEILVETGEAR